MDCCGVRMECCGDLPDGHVPICPDSPLRVCGDCLEGNVDVLQQSLDYRFRGLSGEQLGGTDTRVCATACTIL